jgi:succinoglycan biosynthesis protein ExoV
LKLFYYKGKNFGDAINPMLLGKLFPGFFDEDDQEIFVGIGSILGHVKLPEGCTKAVVFSSGFADGQESTYGKVPVMDERYDVVCVRGKMTAEKIGIAPELGISDGALLLPVHFPTERVHNKRISFMPHHGTLEMYPGWKQVAADCGIFLIDPSDEPLSVIGEICASEIVIAEAMHGAIVSDAYRVPWIPVKTTKLINAFKWNDYLGTVQLEYKPHDLPTLYSRALIQKVVAEKLSRFRLALFSKPVAAIFYLRQQLFVVPRARRELTRIKSARSFLCTEEVLKKRQAQLLDCVDLIKHRYNKVK